MTPWTVACQAPLSMGSLQTRVLERAAMPSSRGPSEPRDRTQVSPMQVDSMLPEPPGKPWNSPGQNTGVGSLSLLQGIFPTQGPNPRLPHCRRFLYQLSHKWGDLMIISQDIQESLQNKQGRLSCLFEKR